MILIPPTAAPCNTNVVPPALAGDAVADALVTVAASRLARTTKPRIGTSRRIFLSRTFMIVLPLCNVSSPTRRMGPAPLWHRPGSRFGSVGPAWSVASIAASLNTLRVVKRLRVLAAMSGGVDSAVAAARAADAGHDVTGVHLALSSNPQSYRSGARGCCTVEDARDARRAADVIGIPFYVWDMAGRFDRDVVTDFVAEYAAGRTPNPCLRCNEKIKFAAVLDRALALGFDAVCTGHHARLDGGRLRRSVDAATDQSYVLAVLNRAQLGRALFPLGGSTKEEVR